MAKNGNHIIIYLDRNKLSFFIPSISQVETIEFKESIIRDLNVVDRKKYKEQIKKYIQLKKLVNCEVILVLAKSVCFETDIEITKDKPYTDQKKAFLDLIPFENVFIRKLEEGKKTKVIAVNRNLYEPLLKVLGELDCKVDIMVSKHLIEKIVDGGEFSYDQGVAIIESMEKIENMNFLGFKFSPEEKEKEKEEVKKVEKKRLLIMIPAFSLLLIVMGILLYFNRESLFLIKKKPMDLSYLTQQAQIDQPEGELTTEGVDQESVEASSSAETQLIQADQLSLEILENLSINVLNGSGIPGQAGKVQDALEEFGFKNIAVGNVRQTTSPKTLVLYKPQVDQATRKAILDILKELRFDYNIQDNQDIDFDVVISTSLQAE
jgi:LytR cell envelope-related transcriptional attenuator